MNENHPFAISELIDMAKEEFGSIEITDNAAKEITDFIFERISGLTKESFSANEVEAVLSNNPSNIRDILGYLEAVNSFAKLPEAPALAAANKRVGNILKKMEGDVEAKINDTLLQEPAEKELAAALAKIKPEADALFEKGDYTNSLKALAALKAPVDNFFDHVMVNAEDPALKANRQCLLATLHQAMNRVADLSKLAA